MLWAVLASGPSMSREVAESVRMLKVVAVSDTYKLAPWADALASQDSAWWLANPQALEFAGRKFSGCPKDIPGTEKIAGVLSGSNSGVLGIRVARALGATHIVLLGFDGHGTHFFGPHTASYGGRVLKNTTDARRLVHMEQHRQEAHDCKWSAVRIFNCTPGTAIDGYPRATLREALCAHGSTCGMP